MPTRLPSGQYTRCCSYIRRHPGSRGARTVLLLARPEAESVGESVTRRQFYRNWIPAPRGLQLVELLAERREAPQGRVRGRHPALDRRQPGDLPDRVRGVQRRQPLPHLDVRLHRAGYDVVSDARLVSPRAAVQADDVHLLQIVPVDGEPVQRGRGGPGERDPPRLAREHGAREEQLVRELVAESQVDRRIQTVPQLHQRSRAHGEPEGAVVLSAAMGVGTAEVPAVE